MVTPTLDAMLPAGSPLRKQLEQDGFIVYVPRHQAYGNRKAKASSELRIDIRVKPLFVRKEAVALCAAAEQGKEKEVQRLLAAGVCADSIDAEGYPALYLACRAGNAETVKHLLEHGADTGLCPLNSNEDALLPIDAADGNPAVIRQMTSHGTRLSPQVIFALLCQEGGMAVAEEALAKKPQEIDWEARIRVRDTAMLHAKTMLQYFVWQRNVPVVAWLLEHGADANADASLTSQNRNAMLRGYPLYYETCCYSYDRANAPNNYALLELFLKHGADPNYREIDPSGHPRYPLGDCINCSRFDLALLLLQYGADGNISTGMTPIFYALTSSSGRPENADKQDLILKVADALVEHGADPKRNAKKPWKPIKEHVNFKIRDVNICSEPLRAWMEKHL